MLNTKDIKTGGGSATPKTLQPGNQAITINKVELEDFKFKPGAFHLLFHCEGEPILEDFEGFFINKDEPSLGRHAGQVGRIKAGQYAFADGTTKSGIEVSRDTDIMRYLKNICIELGCVDWLELQDGKHPTVQSLIAQFNSDAPFKGKWLNVCLAGKEYLNKEGYTNFDLFFPKFSKAGIPFESVEKVTKSKLAKFNTDDHIIKKVVEDVKGFEGQDASPVVKKSFDL
jgi:hypothetical protein